MTYKVGLTSLGCAKNLVDSEIMLGILEKSKYEITELYEDAEILIVNTCGFIDSAKEESINTILELAQLKEQSKLKVLIATGCLAERYKEDLIVEIPELDAVIGTGNYMEILEVIESTLQGQKIKRYGNVNYTFEEEFHRKLSTPAYTAFLKIGDGCDNTCTYCIIPKLRGKFRSRKIEDIIKEANNLAENGVKELILIAQDITQYGIDIYGEYSLKDLLIELDKLEKIHWIRLLYSYPENIDNDLIKVIKNSNKILNYLDIPLQHTEDKILKLMGRKTSKKGIKKLINTLRDEIPDIIIRSSIIVGFPEEDNNDFQDMLNTIKELKLDRVGVFTYSQEEGTPAALLKNQISNEIKEERRNELMIMQQNISLRKNNSLKGSQLEVIIEGTTDDPNIYYGRSYMDAPEIDCIIYVNSSEQLNIGDFYPIKITDGLEYDLIGEINYESTK